MSVASHDITRQSWIERHSPISWGPYIRLARLDRPIGTWLLLFPCWWALALARPTWQIGLYYGVLFALGSVMMRAAGCIINDLLDRDLDAQVARTRSRPLPSGEITPRRAVLFLILLLTISLLILIQFNTVTIALGVASLGLVLCYPLMKRWTWWPQTFLGLTFNWGALIGWCAVTGTLSPTALLLYMGGICWTLAYDTIYAHQDQEDDALVGVRSTARLFGRHSLMMISLFSLMAVMLWAIAGFNAGAGWTWFVAQFVAGIFMLWQIRLLDINDPVNCLARFRAHRMVGWIVLIGALAGGYGGI